MKAWTVHLSWQHMPFLDLDTGEDFDRKSYKVFAICNLQDFVKIWSKDFVKIFASIFAAYFEVKILSMGQNEIVSNLHYLKNTKTSLTFFCLNLCQFPGWKKADVITWNELSMPSGYSLHLSGAVGQIQQYCNAGPTPDKRLGV